MRTQQEILQKTEDLRLRLALLSAEKNHSSMLDPTRELEILALVDKLAAQRGLDLPQEELHSRAVAWERFHGAQTPRTAQQFILSL